MLFSDAITNEAVNDCLKQSLEELRPYMKTGIDSLDLKPTDPLEIDNFEVFREIPPVTIQTKLNNVGINVTIFISVIMHHNNILIQSIGKTLEYIRIIRINIGECSRLVYVCGKKSRC